MKEQQKQAATMNLTRLVQTFPSAVRLISLSTLFAIVKTILTTKEVARHLGIPRWAELPHAIGH